MELLFADKPAGVTTHTSLDARALAKIEIDPEDGFAEHLASRLGPLHVAHRLDRDTSGAMFFARDAQSAEVLRAAFADRRVHKRYLFLTDRAHASSELVAESFIEREKSTYVSLGDREPNARTKFRKLDSSHGLTLWEARPETGKAHQIRLHAADLGLHVLGDQEHGGTADFPTLALHSEELRFEHEGRVYEHRAAPPIWFLKRELARDARLVRWLPAVDRRERLWRSYGPGVSPEETLRFVHSEGDPLRIEQLGSVFSLNWFREAEPSENEWISLRTLMTEMGARSWYLQLRGNRGRAPANESTVRNDVPDRWTALERDLKFEFRVDSGLSPGLFLDQRRNRAWVEKNSQEARVLNLFCYTGGFSVAAARGGAEQVVSVDVSKVFLEWAKTNFTLNELKTEPHEFRAMDSREYLAWAKKKGLKFDLVICDPPSFSRSKSGLFKIEDDLAGLVRALFDVTSPGGRVLFSLNYEKWDEVKFVGEIRAALPKARLERTPSPDWDFELPAFARENSRNMKSIFIVRD